MLDCSLQSLALALEDSSQPITNIDVDDIISSGSIGPPQASWHATELDKRDRKAYRRKRSSGDEDACIASHSLRDAVKHAGRDADARCGAAWIVFTSRTAVKDFSRSVTNFPLYVEN